VGPAADPDDLRAGHAPGVVAAAIVSMFVGKDLADDPEYQARLRAGSVPPAEAPQDRQPLAPAAKASALIFLAGWRWWWSFGFFPRCAPCRARRAPSRCRS
jgi:anaerobic C4-dicarboxylate transporter